MRQIRLGVLDRDLEYLEPLKAYFRSSEGGDTAKAFRLAAFTRKEALEAYHAESGTLDLLLVGGGFTGELATLAEFAAVCCDFGEAPLARTAEPAQRIPFVAKYQPLDQLTAALRTIAAERLKEEPGRPGPSTRTVAVYSAAGGCGKSMAAWNLAAGLAYYGSRTLYASLEEFQSEHPFAEASEEDRYGRLLYYAKTDPKSLSTRLGALVQSDPKSGLFSVESLAHSGDIHSLTREETSGLIDGMRAAGYQYIVLDLPASLDERAEAALRSSDAVLWLITDDAVSSQKTARAIVEWVGRLGEPFKDRIVLGVNRFTGAPGMSQEAAAGLVPAFRLPYVPEWKNVASPAQLLNPGFQDLLAGAVQAYFAEKEEFARA